MFKWVRIESSNSLWLEFDVPDISFLLWFFKGIILLFPFQSLLNLSILHRLDSHGIFCLFLHRRNMIWKNREISLASVQMKRFEYIWLKFCLLIFWISLIINAKMQHKLKLIAKNDEISPRVSWPWVFDENVSSNLQCSYQFFVSTLSSQAYSNFHSWTSKLH